MKRILFVDDEPQVLDGIKDLLRKQRREWDMVFAPGGAAALDEMSRGPFDVVVSDMRMPGMDGAAFLQKVKALYPGTARIVLSGHAEEEMVLKALPVAHQYLSKPCSAEMLRTVIERACELQAWLVDPTIRDLVRKLDKLPSLPAVYWELMRVLADPDVALADVGGIIEQDPAAAAKLLQIVNSAFFGLPQRIVSIDKAVSYLGLQLVKTLAITLHVFSAAESIRVPGFSLEWLQESALLVAEIAKELVRDPRRGEEAFTAGLLRDLGKIILAIGVPERFAEALRLASQSQRPLHVVEKELLGVSHAEVGAFLLGTWGLPLPIVTAVAYHHAPAAAAPGDGEVIVAVHVADALVEEAGPAGVAGHLDASAIERLGLSGELVRWRAIAEGVMRRRAETR